MTKAPEMEKAVEAAALRDRFEKAIRDYEYDADYGYSYDEIQANGQHTNPNAERSRQSALLLREALAALSASPPRSAEGWRPIKLGELEPNSVQVGTVWKEPNGTLFATTLTEGLQINLPTFPAAPLVAEKETKR